MATQTLQFASFENGLIVCELDINTANWRISAVRVINNSDHGLEVFVYQRQNQTDTDLGDLVFNEIATANQTSSWNTSGVQFGWQDQYYNTDTLQWEDGGLDLGVYTIQARTV